MRRLFGTDGIRGEAGTPPLDDATVSRIGHALVATLAASGDARPALVMGCDTRASSAAIANALAGGILAAGGTVRHAGVIPTPGVAYLVRTTGASAGVVISASHNPWRDNGVKVISREGRKLPDAAEAEIERLIDAAPVSAPVETAAEASLVATYVDFLASSVPHRLDGLTVVIDAGHGAAHWVAPRAFVAAGARVVSLGSAPDGRNINDGCGAVHPDGMRAAVVHDHADLGIALDGDADRIAVADGEGGALDGDDVLYLWTLELEREGRKPDAVVGTVMTNFGLERALAERGIRLVRAPVGDRYVAEEMERHGALLGGEPSGHLIRSDLTTTGDGTLTGLHLAALVAATGRPLATLPRIRKTPQVLVNVKVKERVPFERIEGLAEATRHAERELDREGRVLLRYSGTEPLARVMVEGTDRARVEAIAAALAALIREAIGA